MTKINISLPQPLLQLLDEKSKKLNTPKDKLIEKALTIYLDQLNKSDYIKSFKQMAKDENLLAIREEDMENYLSQLEK